MHRYPFRHPRKAATAPDPQAPPPEENFNRVELLRLLKKKHPSKYMEERLKAAEKEQEEEEEDEESDGFSTVDSLEDDDDSTYEDDSTEDDEEVRRPSKKHNSGFILMMENGLDEESDEDEESDCDAEAPAEKKYMHLVNRRQPSERKYVKSLPESEKEALIKNLESLGEFNRETVPLRVKLIRSSIPDEFKAVALKKMIAMEEAQDGEAHKLRYWVTNFMDIPFGVFSPMPVTIEDGVAKCQSFMAQTKATLDKAVFGMNDAKVQIMQWFSTILVNPASAGTAIGIQGPMGTGKTTLVKEGICKALDRPFAFISLGGATDSAVFEGHHVTYEGSTWGRIVQILLSVKRMDPIIVLDEVDKISKTKEGDQIENFLIHLIDRSQNDKFQDKYFQGIHFDLSRVTFIFTMNDPTVMSPILRDRMYMVNTEGYTAAQKLVIAKEYILPQIRANVRLSEEEVVLPDEALNYMIEHYTGGEKGVRKLQRCVETVFNKINLKRFEGPGVVLFEGDKTFAVEFPVTVDNALVAKLLKQDEPATNLHMYL